MNSIWGKAREIWGKTSLYVPLVISIVAILVSIYSLKSTLKSTLEGNLRNHMLAYVEEFQKVAGSIDDPFSVDGYLALSHKEKARVQIVLGLLAGVVDLMNEADDPRADEWAGFLTGIPGPLADGYRLEVWVRNQKTRDEIELARQQVKNGLNGQP